MPIRIGLAGACDWSGTGHAVIARGEVDNVCVQTCTSGALARRRDSFPVISSLWSRRPPAKSGLMPGRYGTHPADATAA